ncbi:MAG TPA: hypothetical protein VGE97_04415, partial [Nitrososphaera sp.]
SYKDFLLFEVDGTEHKMTHKTIRNKFSRLRRNGIIELSYNCGIALYSLKGIKFGKPMTPNHTGGASCYQHPITKIIQTLPFDKAALHDIHMRFEVSGCWSLLSANPDYAPNPTSQDIRLPLVASDGIRIRVTVHKTDTISVVVGCSYHPVAADISGIIRLSNALVRVEEMLLRRLQDCGKAMADIPHHKNWIITMWHFGADASVEYTGERFSASWETGQKALIRVYSKEFPGTVRGRSKAKVRVEKQQYPGFTIEQIVGDLLQL